MPRIPGADALGFGFDVLGPYDLTSITQQIFQHQSWAASEYTFPATGITYEVPDNTAVIPNTYSDQDTYFYESRESFQDMFASRAGISGSYGGFSGQFDAAYSATFGTTESWTYALSQQRIRTWDLSVMQTSGWLSDAFSQDPDVEALKAPFDPSNPEPFFRVFRKWGTHVVTRVTCGGRLDYWVAVMTQYSTSLQQIKANVDIEYKAVLTKVKGDAQAEWSKLGYNWAFNRTSKLTAFGGDTSGLIGFAPGYGDNRNDEYDAWLKTADDMPTVVDFTLTPLSSLFSGPLQDAVAAALTTYLNGAIVAYGNSMWTPGKGPGGGNYTTSSGLIVAGEVMTPNPPVTPPPPSKVPPANQIAPQGGFRVALVDPKGVEPLMSHLYYQEMDAYYQYAPPNSSEMRIYDAMMADIAAVDTPDYYAAVVAFGVDLSAYPSSDFAEWLASIGAQLEAWKWFVGRSVSVGQASYVCIGRKGLAPGRALEAFNGVQHWEGPYGHDITASATALLYAHSPLTVAGAHAFASLAPDGE